VQGGHVWFANTKVGYVYAAVSFNSSEYISFYLGIKIKPVGLLTPDKCKSESLGKYGVSFSFQDNPGRDCDIILTIHNRLAIAKDHSVEALNGLESRRL
jgi:hypothetical protein